MARINDYTRVHELADDDVLIVDSASDSGAGTRTITVSDLFSGSLIGQGRLVQDANAAVDEGVYTVNTNNCTNMPNGYTDLRATIICFVRGSSAVLNQLIVVGFAHNKQISELYIRNSGDKGSSWSNWTRIATSDDISHLSRRIDALTPSETDKSAFDYYYDLMGMDVDISTSEGVTTITQNTDDASCVTTITEGEPTKISAVITPKEGNLKYIRTTTITSTESGSSIHQEYSSQAK